MAATGLRGLQGLRGPREQRAIKAIPATPDLQVLLVLQVLQDHLGQQAHREFPGPGGLRGLLRLWGLLLLGKGPHSS